jgi:hypothetical protein
MGLMDEIRLGILGWLTAPFVPLVAVALVDFAWRRLGHWPW